MHEIFNCNHMVGFWVSFTPMQGIFNHIFSHPSSYSTSPHLFCRTRSRILKNNAKIVHAQKEKKELAGYGFIVYYQYYTITWLLWAFSLVVDRDLLKDTHRWRQIHVRSRQQTCFSFFMPQKSFNKPFEFLLYKTNRLHFPVCVYCNRSQKTSQRVKNNSHATRIRLVSYFFVLYTLWQHLWSITVHTHGKM